MAARLGGHAHLTVVETASTAAAAVVREEPGQAELAVCGIGADLAVCLARLARTIDCRQVKAVKAERAYLLLVGVCVVAVVTVVGGTGQADARIDEVVARITAITIMLVSAVGAKLRTW